MKQWVVQFVEQLLNDEEPSPPTYLDLYAVNYACRGAGTFGVRFTTTALSKASRFATKDIAQVVMHDIMQEFDCSGLMFNIVCAKEPAYTPCSYQDIYDEALEAAGGFAGQDL